MQSMLVEELAEELAHSSANVGFLNSRRLHRPPSTFHWLPFYHRVQILCQSISNDSILMLASATDAIGSPMPRSASAISNLYRIGIDCLQLFQLQWKPLNVITDNVIVWLMWSNWPSFVKSQITLSKVFYRRRKFAYCYHSDNVITFCLSQSDHIKRLPLYQGSQA